MNIISGCSANIPAEAIRIFSPLFFVREKKKKSGQWDHNISYSVLIANSYAQTAHSQLNRAYNQWGLMYNMRGVPEWAVMENLV